MYLKQVCSFQQGKSSIVITKLKVVHVCGGFFHLIAIIASFFVVNGDIISYQLLPYSLWVTAPILEVIYFVVVV